MTKEEWIAALRLSHMWGFHNVRVKAIEMLEGNAASLDMIERLKLANELHITQWIRPSYQHLMTRDRELKLDEVPWLGPDFVRKVTKAREERTKLFLLRVLGREVIVLCPTCKKQSLQLKAGVLAPSPERTQPGPEAKAEPGDSVPWMLQCVPASNHQYYYHQRGEWTLEELVRETYKGTSADSLMRADVDILVDKFLPIS